MADAEPDYGSLSEDELVKMLDEEQLKKMAGDRIPPPNQAAGMARAFGEGVAGPHVVQPNPEFDKSSPIESSGANVMGRIFSVLAPMYAGRAIGRGIGGRIRPTVDAAAAGDQAMINSANTLSGVRGFPAQTKALMASRAGRRAEAEAEAANKSAARLQSGMGFGGGLAGAALGGGLNAGLHDEDTLTGGALGAGAAVAPVAARPFTKGSPVGTAAISGGAAYLASKLAESGGPDWLTTFFKDYSLGKNPGWGKK